MYHGMKRNTLVSFQVPDRRPVSFLVHCSALQIIERVYCCQHLQTICNLRLVPFYTSITYNDQPEVASLYLFIPREQNRFYSQRHMRTQPRLILVTFHLIQQYFFQLHTTLSISICLW